MIIYKDQILLLYYIFFSREAHLYWIVLFLPAERTEYPQDHLLESLESLKICHDTRADIIETDELHRCP